MSTHKFVLKRLYKHYSEKPRSRNPQHIYTNSLTFYLWRTGKLCFHSGWIIVHFHPQCTRAPISLHPQHLLLSVFFITATLVCVSKHSLVVLICISFIANDIEPLLLPLLVIYMSSLQISCPFYIILIFSLLTLKCSLYTRNICFLQVLQIFSPTLWIVILLSWCFLPSPPFIIIIINCRK